MRSFSFSWREPPWQIDPDQAAGSGDKIRAAGRHVAKPDASRCSLFAARLSAPPIGPERAQGMFGVRWRGQGHAADQLGSATAAQVLRPASWTMWSKWVHTPSSAFAMI